ncbi:bifunctional 3'-5' exonuclease/DNA polymerase [Microbacterium sp. DT81.1]|uniref:bifunctional 3'-5' exonuclease/DNA polymerase n=1 Tax=Microbacterium sp. DT81.1 TaxID=3393413 RepID=UPI003CF89E7A
MTSSRRAEPAPAWIVLGRVTGVLVGAVLLDADSHELARIDVPASGLAEWVAARERDGAPRWVWSDTPTWYGPLLEAGVRVARCHDLRLCHAILRDSAYVRSAEPLRAAREWDAPSADLTPGEDTLFEVADASGPTGAPDGLDAAMTEFPRQRAALASSDQDARLRLLLAAESAGALIASELRSAGVPWDAAAHDAILTDILGARPVGGGNPAELERTGQAVREALGDPALSLDSQPKLMRALHRSGILVESTSRWELAQHDHPAIEPLLVYKKLSRLNSANGWTWLSTWVHDGRFRPVYVPGGVVTGRWASSGGGALQLPRQLRAAVSADPGWTLIVADVAQLEPRVLAGMASDTAMADAARGRDLYAGIVERGAVATRAEAKVAMLGAMYGATTGSSGRLVPRLRSIFPRAMALVDQAARTGEDGGIVTTWLGRSSPPPSPGWREAQSRAGDHAALPADERRARQSARDRGRFTRNFIVQGTAAEWSLAWMAEIRRRLDALGEVGEGTAAPRSGPAFGRRPHLAFFLHDEVILHVPLELADAAADAVRDAAASASRLLFGDFPLDFPLELHIAETAEKT